MTPTFEIMKRYGVLPYIPGGDGFTAIDCASLLRRYFKEFVGIELPESLFDWHTLFHKLGEHELPQKDDMVFMMGANRESIADHVGVFITNSDVMHAGEPYGGVVCESYSLMRRIVLSIWRLKEKCESSSET